MYICKEQGKSFSLSVGDLVLLETDFGPKIMKISYVGPIHTRQYEPNFVYLDLLESDIEWEDLTEHEQDLMLEECNFVQEEDE